MIAEQQCGLTQDVQEKLITVFKNYSRIQKVVLYGSRATGKFKNGSDIDLTIYSSGLTTRDLLAIQLEVDDLLLPYKIDLSLFEHIDHQNLIDHIQKMGKDFYKRSS